MRIGLTFTLDGRIQGEGIDDIAPFTIRGFFDAASNQAQWTKSYVGMHRVAYHGLYDGRSICGDWTLEMATGGFWIWPDALEGKEAIEEELEQPLEAALMKT